MPHLKQDDIKILSWEDVQFRQPQQIQDAKSTKTNTDEIANNFSFPSFCLHDLIMTWIIKSETYY